MNKRTTQWTLTPSEGDSMFHERAYQISITDEGGGEFVIINGDGADQGLRVDPEEWPHLRDVIDEAVRECRELEAIKKLKS